MLSTASAGRPLEHQGLTGAVVRAAATAHGLDVRSTARSSRLLEGLGWRRLTCRRCVRRAFAVGYRMLGSVAEAEDIAQETLLRVHACRTPSDEPKAWVTTVATRLAIDHLRLARVRRESYVGPWLPEPLLTSTAAPARASGPS